MRNLLHPTDRLVESDAPEREDYMRIVALRVRNPRGMALTEQCMHGEAGSAPTGSDVE